ncbi:hypothetical protein Tsubulata_005398 [Turnera subulata]|uniref:Uncharacterized protein n=1 Tax=Turnera subulata TaxID=218843 RepID=A0A9Q0JHQ3_9ROSI|nr:hypothetical protein Tsubulata_005398 [Turnera subulata]
MERQSNENNQSDAYRPQLEHLMTDHDAFGTAMGLENQRVEENDREEAAGYDHASNQGDVDAVSVQGSARDEQTNNNGKEHLPIDKEKTVYDKYIEGLKSKYGEDLSNAPFIDCSLWLDSVRGIKKGRVFGSREPSRKFTESIYSNGSVTSQKVVGEEPFEVIVQREINAVKEQLLDTVKEQIVDTLRAPEYVTRPAVMPCGTRPLEQ